MGGPDPGEWVALYKGGAEYGPPLSSAASPTYHPSLVLKMLLLAYLYNLSERQVELFVNDSLSAKFFLGLGADEPCPDSTTLTVFKRRLLAAKGQEPLERLLAKVLRLAQKKGIVPSLRSRAGFGRIQVVDSVHTIANVNVGKEQGRQAKGKPPRDPHARWGTKGKRRKPSPRHGESSTSGRGEERPHYFFGYKAHVSLNAENHLMTSLTVTHGAAYACPERSEGTAINCRGW